MTLPIELGETIIKFGEGRIGVYAASVNDKLNSIAFSLHDEPHKIGAPVDNVIGKSTNEVGCFLRFQFSNPESIQVLIDTLIEIQEAIIRDPSPGA